MNDLKSTDANHYKGTDYDEPAYGEGPMDGFAVMVVEPDGEYLVHLQAFFENENDKQCRYRASYPKGEKAERIIDYIIGGIGWIEKGHGQTPFAKAIGEFITGRFS